MSSIFRTADLGHYVQLTADQHSMIDTFLKTDAPTSSHVMELGVEGCMARCHAFLGATVTNGDCLVYSVDEDGPNDAVIVKDTGELTKEEVKTNWPKILEAKMKEIKGLNELKCFTRHPRKTSYNRVDTRWVITWKLVDGIRAIKCRLTMRGFRDRQDSLETFAGTASRAGQRAVNSIAAQDPDMILFSFDVSQAFAKGLTFEELAQLTGTPLRQVEFDLQAGDVELLRKLPGFEDFDPKTETLRMLKPIYGLKDAPRAWRKRLHQCLVDFGLVQTLAEAELYVSHESEQRERRRQSALSKETAPYAREISEGEAQQIIQEKINAEKAASDDKEAIRDWSMSHFKKLTMIASAHVDDIKGAARKEIAEALLAHLEKHFGPCKAEWTSFMHVGIQHDHKSGEVYCHQNAYIEALRPLKLATLKGKPDDEQVDALFIEAFQRLLGGAAWTVLTRADVAVYIQALQRRGHVPRVCDCRRLNLVIRYLQRHRIGIRYLRMPERVKLLGFTDSAFRAQEGESSGLALRGLAVLLTPDVPGSVISQGSVHLLDFIVRKLRRVVRSTFAAELNALVDALETIILMQLMFHQIFCGTDEGPDELLGKLENGLLYPAIELVVDAQSVYDALTASDVCNPQELSLKVHLIAIRDKLAKGTLRTLSWSDTRDMLADALTKGGIDRTNIMRTMEQGHFTLQHDVKSYSPCTAKSTNGANSQSK